MAKDKRLLITKAIIQHIQRKHGEEAAQRIGLYLEFVVPSRICVAEELWRSKTYVLPHPVFVADGRSSVLIVLREILEDATKVNKRHRLYDAVVAAESLARTDDVSVRRVAQIVRTFSHFVVDERAVAVLPRGLVALLEKQTNAVLAPGAVAHAETSTGLTQVLQDGEKLITVISALDDRTQRTFALSQGAKGQHIVVAASGICRIRIGHAGLTAGDATENAKTFIGTMKSDFPQVYKHVQEFRLVSCAMSPFD